MTVRDKSAGDPARLRPAMAAASSPSNRPGPREPDTARRRARGGPGAGPQRTPPPRRRATLAARRFRTPVGPTAPAPARQPGRGHSATTARSRRVASRRADSDLRWRNGPFGS